MSVGYAQDLRVKVLDSDWSVSVIGVIRVRQ